MLRLQQDLLGVEETLSAGLDESKVVYVYDGVAHLIATILIDAIVNIRKINKNGVKKMCRNLFSLQHTLTSNITGSRDNSLDQAKQYYELLNMRSQVRVQRYLSPNPISLNCFQDVLSELVEKGPMFSHDQYVKALELLHRSDPNSSAELHQKHVAKLAEIIKRIGVTG